MLQAHFSIALPKATTEDESKDENEDKFI